MYSSSLEEKCPYTSPRAIPAVRAISSICVSCVPRSSKTARVAATRSRSRTLRRAVARSAFTLPRCPENVGLTLVLARVSPVHGRGGSTAQGLGGPAQGAGRDAIALHPAAARRLPRADQPALV